MFEIYKRGQGTTARWITAGGLGGLAAFGAFELRESLSGNYPTGPAATLGGAVLFVAAAAAIAWLINWPRFVDYLIMSEAELRKVSWPTRDELKRQTTVVIFTLVAFAFILLLSDMIFGWTIWHKIFGFPMNLF
jgi:preprotein translocase subunit SecE